MYEPDCIKRLDLQGRLLEMNRGGLDMIEADSFAMVAGHEVGGLVESSHRAAFDALLERAVAGAHGTLTFEIIGLKGGKRWVSALFVPLRAETGEVREILAVTRDVTREQRLERSRGEERAMLERLARGAPLDEVLSILARGYGRPDEGIAVSILLVDGNGDALRLGAAPELPSAYARALDGMPVGNGHGPCAASAATGSPVVDADLQAGRWRDTVGRLAAEHGFRACWSVPFRDSEGRVLGTFAMHSAMARGPGEDETAAMQRGASFAGLAVERDRTLRTLRENETRFRVVSELLSDYAYAFRVEPDGSLVREWVTEAFERITGYSIEALERTGSLAQVIHPEDMPAAIARGRRLREGQDDVSEYRIVTRGGDTRWLRDHAHPEWSEREGRVVRIYGAASDVTESRMIREQFVQAQKMESVGRLAGGVAHDFNNILTVISGTAELVLRGTPPEDARRADLVNIRAASERAARLTRQLLAFSRKQVFREENVDLHLRIANIAPMLRQILGPDIELALQRGMDLRAVRIDPAQFDQVMMNLAANAHDAMPEGGRLEICTENVTARAGAAPAVRITVRDTGVGMDEATLASAFEPFFTTKAVGQGTGLGLAMVYGTIRQSGGDIRAESRPGEGTTFVIDLPAVPGGVTAAGETVSVDTPAENGRSETVLVVEDEPSVRRLVGRILEAAGYSVLTAPNAVAALRVLETHGERVALMLTDVVMPGASGPQLARDVATRFPHIRTLYMSGHAENHLQGQGVDGSHVLITKPFDIAALTRRVREVLDGVA